VTILDKIAVEAWYLGALDIDFITTLLLPIHDECDHAEAAPRGR